MSAEKILKKHVAIIHAFSSMTALQRKIVNVLLFEATQQKKEDKNPSSIAIECHISFNKICKNIQFNSNNNQYLRELIDDLASITIEWNLLKDKVPTNISFLNLRVLHGAPTFFNDNSMNFSFHKVMLDLLENPSVYGSVDLNVQSQFESKYGHSLYENSTRFVNLQKNKIISLETFKKLLGVPEDKYRNVSELMRNVIGQATEEVNDIAPFTIRLEPVKSGRKIEGFNLTAENKAPVNNNTHTLPANYFEESQVTYQTIKKTFGTIKDQVLKNIFNGHAEEYIMEKINYTKAHAKPEKNGFYPIAYFISALKNDYQTPEKFVTPITNYPGDQDKAAEEWESISKILFSDLNHWKKMLGYAEINQNDSQIKIIEDIIAKCQEKIAGHQQNNIKENS